MGIEWNLFSREADQLVTISRDSLLPKGTEWCTSTINSLVRDIIRLTYEQLHDECKECSDKSEKEGLLKQYFNLCLVNWNLPEPLEVDYQLLDDLMLDKKDYFDGEGNAIKASDLFKASALITGDRSYFIDISRVISRIKEFPELGNCICVRDKDMIPDGFICSDVYTCKGTDVVLFRLEKLNGNVHKLVKMKGSWYVYGNETGYHELVDGFEKYAKIVVGGNAPLLGYMKPSHRNCWIYFGGMHGLQFIRRKLGIEKFQDFLKKGYIKKLVPDYIVKLIQKYKVPENNKPTEEEIYDEYIRMILDFTNESEENTDGNEVEKE